jgi:hypothetical protein
MIGRPGGVVPLVRPLGRATRLSAEQHAEVDIEPDEIVCRRRSGLRPGDRVLLPERALVLLGRTPAPGLSADAPGDARIEELAWARPESGGRAVRLPGGR